MVSTSSGKTAAWTLLPPAAYDIVTAYYPEDDQDQPGPKLRPCLVMKVLQGKTSGIFACQVAYGTKELKIIKRQTVDLIVQNTAHVQQMGMARPTRFDFGLCGNASLEHRFFRMLARQAQSSDRFADRRLYSGLCLPDDEAKLCLARLS
jgi:hypothetical protein